MKPVSRVLNLVIAAGLPAAAALAATNLVECDLCVYGGTSGGVSAAVAAARLGKSVALLTQNHHVGGMTASGLGVTDIGPGNDTSYIGGISREFYQRVGQAPDVILALDASTDLVSWLTIPALFELVSCVDEGSVQRITVRLTASAISNVTAYVRLRASRF